MESSIKKLLGRCSLCPFGVCAFEDDLLIKNVRSYKKIPPNSKSIMLFLFPYYVGEFPKRNISKYAMLRDYHSVAGDMLKEAEKNLKREFPFNSFQSFVDSSPIKEVKAAVRAGLGCLGKNSLLINDIYGSYCFIGEIVTDLCLVPSFFHRECLNCGLCAKSCPSGAIGDFGIDESLCLSALTQKKGELEFKEQEKIKRGGSVWGCDICQDVCPLCKNASITPFEEFKEMVVPFVDEKNVEEFFPISSFAWRKKATIMRNIRIVND